MNRFKNWKYPEFDKDGFTKYGWRCQHHDNLKLGKGCDIGSYTYMNAKYGIEIGRDVQIGSHCSIYTISSIDNKTGKIIIEEGACIGTHSTIMPGVKIGKNALVGAYSFVNKNVPKNSVVAGIPAKLLKQKK